MILMQFIEIIYVRMNSLFRVGGCTYRMKDISYKHRAVRNPYDDKQLDWQSCKAIQVSPKPTYPYKTVHFQNLNLVVTVQSKDSITMMK